MMSNILPFAEDLKQIASSFYKDINNQKISLNRLSLHLATKAKGGEFSTVIVITDFINRDLLGNDRKMNETIIKFYRELLISSLKERKYEVFSNSEKDLNLHINWM